MIQRNLYNPIPLHESKAKWYENYPTFKGACNYVAAPNGYLLPMQLTCGVADIPQLSLAWALEGNLMADDQFEGSAVPVSMGYGLESRTSHHTLEYDYRQGYYQVRYDSVDCCKVASLPTEDDYKFTAAELMGTGSHTFYAYGVGTTQEVKVYGSMLSAAETLTAKLVYYNDGTETNVNLTAYYDIVPDKYRNTQRCATIYLGGGMIAGGAKEGLYYLQIPIGGNVYYTEPFMWLNDLTNFVHITYRRSQPVLTTKNYVPFTQLGRKKFMEMWVKSICAKPPFHYEEDIEDMDGRKFVEKQVSYRDDQFDFLCSAYFADAVRLLWHCDERQYAQFGDIRDVDYMEPPDPNWDVDSHLCEITIEFQSDTIVQTNGEANMAIDGSTGSFNGDYNEDYENNA